MKIEILQIRNNNGEWIDVFPNDKPQFKYCGYIELDSFDESKCWHLCNWSEWNDKKPYNLHSDLTYCNSDVAFHNPTDDSWFIAKSVGWKRCLTLKEAKLELKNRH